MTFNLLTKFLLNFPQLEYLTVESEDSNDLINGTLWESFLSKIQLRTFNFRFRFRYFTGSHPKSAQEIMKSFRSSFWIREKQSYVGHRSFASLWDSYNEIYSIPHFCPTTVPFFGSDKSISSTAPLATEKKMFSSTPTSFSLHKNDKLTKLSNYYFNNIKQLELNFDLYRSIFSFDNLKHVMDLNHIQCLNISRIALIHSPENIEL
jgi:hypothetical protein